MTKIQLRHDTAANFASENPILLAGEAAIETDTNKMKIGDGTTAYNSLEYFGGDTDLSNYYNKTETDDLLDEKQNKITSVYPLNLSTIEIPYVRGITENNGIIQPSGNNYVSISNNYYTIDPTSSNYSRIITTYEPGQIISVPVPSSNTTGSSPFIAFGKLLPDGNFVPYIVRSGGFNNNNNLRTIMVGTQIEPPIIQPYGGTSLNRPGIFDVPERAVFDWFGSYDTYKSYVQLYYTNNAIAVQFFSHFGTSKSIAGTSVFYNNNISSTDATALDTIKANITHAMIVFENENYSYDKASFGKFNYSGRVGWTQPETEAAVASLGENLLDFDEEFKEAKLSINISTGLDIQNGNLVNTNPTPVTVDQTYDPTSTNAQSGTAVAEAISDCVQNDELVEVQVVVESSAVSLLPSFYKVFSDGTCIQGGNCTSGTAVTFLKEFANTNYINTCAASASSTTGFTPSTTGSYIVVGQVNLAATNN